MTIQHNLNLFKYRHQMRRFSSSDDTGLWMQFTTFECDDSVFPYVTLIPMIHVGNKEFYYEAKDEILCHDIVLYEGAYIPMRRLYSWFNLIVGMKTRLSLQGGAGTSENRLSDFKYEYSDGPKVREAFYQFGDLPERKIRQIIADCGRRHFLAMLRKMPLSAKLAFPFMLVFLMLAAPFVITRDALISLGHGENCDCCHCYDKPKGGFTSKSQTGRWDFFGWCLDQYKVYLLQSRDDRLKNILFCEMKLQAKQTKTIAVQYGEAHMGQLADFLEQHGYREAGCRNVLAISKQRTLEVEDEICGYGAALKRLRQMPTNIWDCGPSDYTTPWGGFYHQVDTNIHISP